MNWDGGILEGFGLDWPRALVLAMAVVTVAALGVGAVTSTTAFGPYNPAWDGASDVRAAITANDGELVLETDRYETVEASETVAVVVAPERGYTADDLRRVADFVDRGGTLVVFENFGDHGNDLLDGVGAELRFDGGLLLDDTEYAESTRMPIAAATDGHPITDTFDRLTLNYATAVDTGAANATVLASTSNHSYLGSAETDLDAVEDLQSYPVAAAESVENGTVVAVGDPSITINEMYDAPDNAAFLSALSADSERVLFDYSHGDDVPPLVSTVFTIREEPILQVAVMGSILTICGLTSTGRLSRIRTRFSSPSELDLESGYPGTALSRADRIAYLTEQFPDWDDERVARVIDALNRPDSKREGE